MPGKFCNTCVYWEKDVYRSHLEVFGRCQNGSVEMKVTSETGEEDLEFDPVLFTEQHFGCIYHSEHENVLVPTDKIVKDELRRNKGEDG